jgi:hypothetical protein
MRLQRAPTGWGLLSRLVRAPRSSMTWEQAARRLGGTVYAAAGAGPAYQGGYGHSGHRRVQAVSVTVRHAAPGIELEVETSSEERWPDELADWRLLNEVVHRAAQPDRVAFPFEPQLDRWEQEVLVDGAAGQFVFVGNEAGWSAAGTAGGRQVTVTSSGWAHDGLTLTAVPAHDVRRDGPDHR